MEFRLLLAFMDELEKIAIAPAAPSSTPKTTVAPPPPKAAAPPRPGPKPVAAAPPPAPRAPIPANSEVKPKQAGAPFALASGVAAPMSQPLTASVAAQRVVPRARTIVPPAARTLRGPM